ncbi:MAG: transglycosylase SLT domain-containing protein [Candidatus Diapherotrites archaeon]|nr:transglycosylase SLT domain-containing protein [Candidatus Diapherotrites archaeon]
MIAEAKDPAGQSVFNYIKLVLQAPNAPSPSVTPTSTSSPTGTPTVEPSKSPTPSPTGTPVPPTNTPTATATVAATVRADAAAAAAGAVAGVKIVKPTAEELAAGFTLPAGARNMDIDFEATGQGGELLDCENGNKCEWFFSSDKPFFNTGKARVTEGGWGDTADKQYPVFFRYAPKGGSPIDSPTIQFRVRASAPAPPPTAPAPPPAEGAKGFRIVKVTPTYDDGAPDSGISLEHLNSLNVTFENGKRYSVLEIWALNDDEVQYLHGPSAKEDAHDLWKNAHRDQWFLFKNVYGGKSYERGELVSINYEKTRTQGAGLLKAGYPQEAATGAAREWYDKVGAPWEPYGVDADKAEYTLREFDEYFHAVLENAVEGKPRKLYVVVETSDTSNFSSMLTDAFTPLPPPGPAAPDLPFLVVAIDTPADGSMFNAGDAIPFKARVYDSGDEGATPDTYTCEDEECDWSVDDTKIDGADGKEYTYSGTGLTPGTHTLKFHSKQPDPGGKLYSAEAEAEVTFTLVAPFKPSTECVTCNTVLGCLMCMDRKVVGSVFEGGTLVSLMVPQVGHSDGSVRGAGVSEPPGPSAVSAVSDRLKAYVAAWNALPDSDRAGEKGKALVRSWMVDVSRNYGVNPAMALALLEQESGGVFNAVSPVGAVGAGQIMPFNFTAFDSYVTGSGFSVETSPYSGSALASAKARYAAYQAAHSQNPVVIPPSGISDAEYQKYFNPFYNSLAGVLHVAELKTGYKTQKYGVASPVRGHCTDTIPEGIELVDCYALVAYNQGTDATAIRLTTQAKNYVSRIFTDSPSIAGALKADPEHYYASASTVISSVG